MMRARQLKAAKTYDCNAQKAPYASADAMQ